jgi:hypothetical protein
MAYIGRTVDVGMFEKQVITADSSTTTFTLTFAVGSANSLLVVYGGVIQEPAVAYSVSGGGQSIVFSEAPVTGTTTYIIYLGKQLTTPRAAGQETTKQTFAGDGSTVTYTLTDPPVVPAGIMVFVDGILQREGSGNNYVSSGSTITFSTAPDISAEIDVYTLVKEKVSIDTVADGSITFTKLVAGSPTWNGAGETVIATASTGNSLRITNTGSGNSLLVEDSASTDSSPFVIDASGSVGIGIASPLTKLQVVGTTLLSSASTYGASTAAISVYNGASSVNYYKADNNYFQLAAGTDTLTINSAGNVGIGTTSPDQLLTLNGANTTTNTLVSYKQGGTTYGYTGLGQTNQMAVQASVQINIQATAATPITFLTNNAERMRIASDGKVGIGNSSPAAQNLHVGSGAGGSTAINGYTRLAVEASDYAVVTVKCPAANFSQIIFADSATTNLGGINYFGSTNATPNAMAFLTGGGTERMRLNGNGQLLIGHNATGMAGQLQVKGLTAQASTNTYYAQTLSAGSYADTGSYTTMMGFGCEGHTWSKGAIGYTRTGSYDRGYFAFYINTATDATTCALADEKIRIDAAGNLGINGSDAGAKTYLAFNPGNQVGLGFAVSSGTFTNPYVRFNNSAGNTIGTINSNNSTTSYNTSSDYRLKENIAPMTGALAKVEQLKPVTYTWKDSGLDSQGFIAHEIQEVVPDCVTGEKDAVDADDKPIYQGIDTSFLVATLTAAIQELKAIVDAQAVEIAALKAK